MALLVVVLVPITLFATFLAVTACIGTEGNGVDANSVRGTACDIPALGPWPYTLGVALLVSLVAARSLSRSSITAGRRLAVIVAASALILAVPAALAMLPPS